MCVHAKNSLARALMTARGRWGVASVGCHGGIGALPWLQAEPGVHACAYHRLEPVTRQTALYRYGVCWLPGPGQPPAREGDAPMTRTSDTRITGYEPLFSPAALLDELPLTDAATATVEQS